MVALLIAPLIRGNQDWHNAWIGAIPLFIVAVATVVLNRVGILTWKDPFSATQLGGEAESPETSNLTKAGGPSEETVHGMQGQIERQQQEISRFQAENLRQQQEISMLRAESGRTELNDKGQKPEAELDVAVKEKNAAMAEALREANETLAAASTKLAAVMALHKDNCANSSSVSC